MGIVREVDLSLDSGRGAIIWGACVKRQEGVGVDVPTDRDFVKSYDAYSW
jgi:hypothetical protein